MLLVPAHGLSDVCIYDRPFFHLSRTPRVEYAYKERADSCYLPSALSFLLPSEYVDLQNTNLSFTCT